MSFEFKDNLLIQNSTLKTLNFIQWQRTTSNWVLVNQNLGAIDNAY